MKTKPAQHFGAALALFLFNPAHGHELFRSGQSQRGGQFHHTDKAQSEFKGSSLYAFP